MKGGDIDNYVVVWVLVPGLFLLRLAILWGDSALFSGNCSIKELVATGIAVQTSFLHGPVNRLWLPVVHGCFRHVYYLII
jgi:hypothetical protein